MSKSNSLLVPVALRRWFLVHFIVDIIVAIPLFFFPKTFLQLFSWPQIDPLATRLVAAALFGIGLESLFGRNGDRNHYKEMLNLKVIWSAFAISGVALTMFTEKVYQNTLSWVVLSTFIFFLLLWLYWRFYLATNK